MYPLREDERIMGEERREGERKRGEGVRKGSISARDRDRAREMRSEKGKERT